MPYIAKELVEDRPEPITARLDEPVQKVLDRMFEYDFSQLPVLGADDRPIGLITSESILRTLRNFGIGLEDILVEHAWVAADKFREDAELFDLLDRLRDRYAVLIVDREGNLTGIVTDYDTAAYFRRRTQDMMLVEDIESTLKDYIQAAYAVDDDNIDEERLNEAVGRITDTVQEQRNAFTKALRHYLSLHTSEAVSINDDVLSQVLEQHYRRPIKPKTFANLTFYEYVQVLLDNSHWGRYQNVFKLESGPIRTLLDHVRETRNSLAHFRGEILPSQREALEYCAAWLSKYQDAIPSEFSPQESEDGSSDDTGQSTSAAPDAEAQIDIEDMEIIPVEDDPHPSDSRYAPLAIWLRNQPASVDLVKPTFSEVEEIIGGPLPESARGHRSWWANDSVGHVQSQQWLDVGWRFSSVNMSSETVRSARVKDRQKAYIDFFSALLHDLRDVPEFADVSIAPQGVSWYTIRRLSFEDTDIGNISFSFGRQSIFRIELYLDSGDAEINDRIFDTLQERKETIEDDIGETLTWLRLSHRRASRVALIYENHRIDNTEEQLENLRQQAIEDMARFARVMTSAAEEAAKAVLI